MCVAGCLEAIRRGGLRAPAAPAGARALARAVPPRDPPRRFARVVDLTHAMGPDFPCFDPGPGLVVETVATLAADGYNMRR